MPHRVLSIVGGLRVVTVVAMWLVAAPVFLPIHPATAQTNEPAPPADQSGANPDAAKIDEFAEAQRLLSGPAGNPECVWSGTQVVSLLTNNDIDTAFRHLDLYDRFGCPGGHIQAAFRCYLLHPVPMTPDRKPPEQKAADLRARVRACWINPVSPEVATPAPAAAPSTAASSPTSTH
jgi:hypothetical protein